MPQPNFIHLSAKSSFSLLEGLLPVKKLARVAEKQGLAALGVTDLGNVFGAVEVSKYLAGAGIQPILGAELRVSGTDGTIAGMLTLLVQNEEGWRHLARLVSEAELSKNTQNANGEAVITLARVCELQGGLICLSGAYGRGFAPQAIASGRLATELAPLVSAFGDRFYTQLERHGAAGEKEVEHALRTWATTQNVPLVATNDCRFAKATDLAAFEVLVGIGDGVTMDDPARRRFTPNHHLRTEADMLATFADLPAACANTVEIARRCAYLIPQVQVKQMFMPQWKFDGDTPVAEVIGREARAGLNKRLNGLSADGGNPGIDTALYAKRLEDELTIICSMGFAGYFLITSDFIRWAKSQGIPVGPGRGSGAGSLVAWALDITDLDPIRWNLFFERFLNPERISLPDFDIDFCQDRRDEVIEYVRQRHGDARVGHIITFGTLKARACLRDVGRVLGLGYNFVGQIAGFIPEGANPPPIAEVLESDERLRARYDAEDDVKRLIDTALELEGCYRHASTHAAGVIIADRDLAEVCGLFVDPRSSIPVTQFTMYDAEYAGLVKFDFLGLKTLSIIRAAENMVRQHTPHFAIATVPLDDATTFDMLKRGETCGVFQIESAGMTDLTRKMKANDMEALSALIALYRPGPMDLIPQYLDVRLGRKEPEYPHPLLEETLKVTFGIAVYQEQVIQMARVLAGYSLGQGDMLRRAMGKKKPEEMAKERSKFVAGAAACHGIAEEDSNRIFGLMETFAGYGFNKAHSMAYALISYQTAYLKANHLRAFMAATMTYDRGNHDKLLRYKEDMAKLGVPLLAPNINQSDVYFTVEGQNVRHALSALKGAGEEAMRLLVAERQKGGSFKNIWDVLARLEPQVLNKRQLEVLAKAGVFDDLEPKREWLLGNMDVLLAYGAACVAARASGQGDLFGGGASGKVDHAPYLAACKTVAPWDYLERLQFEAEAVGFYLSAHPLSAFAQDMQRLVNLKPLADLETFAEQGGGVCKLAGIVLNVRELKTKKGDRMGITLLSDPSGQGEVVFFPEAYTACQQLLESGKPLAMNVKVAKDGERLRVNAEVVKLLEEALGERPELVITVQDPTVMARVKGMLDGASNGHTAVRLVVPSHHGDAVLKLPRKLGVSATMLANLRGLAGVGVR